MLAYSMEMIICVCLLAGKKKKNKPLKSPSLMARHHMSIL